jgi:hypothetical protein
VNHQQGDISRIRTIVEIRGGAPLRLVDSMFGKGKHPRKLLLPAPKEAGAAL